ncbi:hypothetical protein BU24DRAFT_421282 [Aaosphaeria arxii CBS 175.79]|uniref:Uncharacterized protein n=1 Tax=Aaosphaeria arxii CBS 175.79 TaxID=1450172 RepID=A0A6A5Y172_9PLEO|nr:uncharacterized protein BU24DRAFT_421282 [Aaosphaeria arxii CBS 175.79]KAF2018304.1 hypothetical protein BU24DRAFT_421282 [Aaosphaeria arxii CBS 175.79]
MQFSTILSFFAFGATIASSSPTIRKQARQHNCVDCEIQIATQGVCSSVDWCCWKEQVYLPANNGICGGCPIQEEASANCP